MPADRGADRHDGERIRVLHLITRLVLGGAQENTLLTAGGLDRGRYAVTLASGPTFGPEGSLEDRIPGGIPFERVPDLVRDPHPVKDLVTLARLYRMIRRGRYHIVHTHTTKAGLLGRLAAKAAGVPIIVHTPHGHAFHDYLGVRGSEALKWAERGLARITDRIICLTPAERDDHVHLRIGPAGLFEVIHSGVDLERFRHARVDPESLRRALGLRPSGPLVVCVARLVPVKGVEYLLEAVPLVRAAVPAATVMFVGDGPLRPLMERRAAALVRGGAVAFLGLRSDVPEILKLSDVAVLPSLNEGMGRAAVEALAAGRPVVASRVSGIQDIVVDGETGFLVPPADPRALADAVVRVLVTSGLAQAMGARAAQSVGAYGIEAMINGIDRLYVRLLSSSGTRAESLRKAGLA